MSDSKPLQETARRLLDLFGLDGKHWTRGTLARTKKGGREVDPDDKKAGAWCLLGGLKKVNQLDQASVLADYISEQYIEYSDIPDFNDSEKWPAIKNLLMKLAHPYSPKKEKK